MKHVTLASCSFPCIIVPAIVVAYLDCMFQSHCFVLLTGAMLTYNGLDKGVQLHFATGCFVMPSSGTMALHLQIDWIIHFCKNTGKLFMHFMRHVSIEVGRKVAMMHRLYVHKPVMESSGYWQYNLFDLPERLKWRVTLTIMDDRLHYCWGELGKFFFQLILCTTILQQFDLVTKHSIIITPG